ncbi:flavin-containing monooxygenase [Pseudonocardia alni]|uniref:flavin-containing monooxygenase n=1 Tax=Pseudonocardia alni TaxID=33907 RepID=UPI0033290B98
MATTIDYDCIIIGAGFAGLRALIETRRRGLSAKLIEAGSDVGGTWHWNRYPGARTDSESWVYCFSFDEDLLQDWVWPERYPDRSAMQRYLSHVADRFDLRRDIEFGTRVERAVRDDDTNTWTVECDAETTLRCTFLIPAVGPLSAAYEPPFPGLESFRGERYLTARWPEEEVDVSGKRVAVVGTGATGVQLIPQLAQTAGHLTVFQRTPNYVMPARNCPIDPAQDKAIKADYPAIWEQVRGQVFGFPMNPAGRVFSDVDENEARRVLERGWEIGGFRFLFETFDDLLVDQRCNDVASEFVRNKIRAIVRDRDTAELLAPKNHPLGSKRPPLGHYYYETYNRANVSLVDVSTDPIEQITETGLRLADGSVHDVDVLIFATGFDAATGALTAIDIRGSEGRSLREVWADGARTHLGIAVTGFPNMFMLGGPGFPFGNFPPTTEVAVEWAADAIEHLRESGHDVMEADVEAMDAWSRTLQEIVDATVLGQGEAVNTWFLGANVPGKAHVPLFYLGGIPGYFAELQDSVDRGYSGFTFSRTVGNKPESARV